MTILFPSSYLNAEVPDEAFQKEYESAVEIGFDIILFNQRIWDESKKVKIRKGIFCDAIYRGWMMKPKDYHSFYIQLEKLGIYLLTSPKQYETMHLFPNVYKKFKKDTPKMLTFPLYASIDVASLQNSLGNFLIKDYVKSAKNTDFPTFFNKETSQEEFDRWMGRFYEIRGELLTGGIIAKQYINLKRYEGYPNEYRVFYLKRTPISVSRNSLQPEYTPKVPHSLVAKYADLPSPFYTIDFAEKEDGSWIVIEAGDGSVSGLSERQNYNAFFRAIKIICAPEEQRSDPSFER